VWTAPNAESVRVAPFDPERGSIVEDSGATWEQFIQSRGRPDWSADGHYLSFISCGHTGGGPCSLFVRDVVASTVREVPHDLSYFAWPRLSPDGRQLATNGTDKKGRRGAYLVDIATGQTVPIEPAAGVMDWSADGRRLYLVRLDETQATVVERDLSSGSNRDLFRMSRTGLRNYMQTSPDGRLLGTIVESGNAATLMVTRLADGVSTPVLTVTQPEVLAWKWEWTEDSAALLIIKGTPSTGGVWLVSLNGVAKRLEIPVGGEGVQISPDRTRVAFVAGAAVANGAEVWALENVIPPAAK
jgi:Tol biopolymer transport system component